jgi:hypothetical protein
MARMTGEGVLKGIEIVGRQGALRLRDIGLAGEEG